MKHEGTGLRPDKAPIGNPPLPTMASPDYSLGFWGIMVIEAVFGFAKGADNLQEIDLT